MHDLATVEAVLKLVDTGLNDCEVARRAGVPRSTVRCWRIGEIPRRSRASCEICAGKPTLIPEPEYAYLLGVYLGDGCISEHPRSYRLRITLDAAYPGIIEECASALKTIRPENVAGIGRHGQGCVEVGMYWTHWPCLFPQHGPGKKHLREIKLVPWQLSIVEANRRPLIRGLIHSDGCRVVANDRGVASVRYHFSNLSDGIKRIYCESLDALQIPWTQPSHKDIAVYRKAATARLDEFIGPKR